MSATTVHGWAISAGDVIRVWVAAVPFAVTVTSVATCECGLGDPRVLTWESPSGLSGVLHYRAADLVRRLASRAEREMWARQREARAAA